jgi:biopolymer transport protein TolR
MEGSVQNDRRSQIHSEINVTPLVDVCLVLLIIFMVVTPIITNGPSVQLPKTSHPEKKPQTSGQLPIALLFDDPPQILFGKDFRRLNFEEFRATTQALYQKSPNEELVLRADKRITYGNVRAVLLVLREAGFHNVGLIAEPDAAAGALR